VYHNCVGSFAVLLLVGVLESLSWVAVSYLVNSATGAIFLFVCAAESPAAAGTCDVGPLATRERGNGRLAAVHLVSGY
jgi:hypothetical protein